MVRRIGQFWNLKTAMLRSNEKMKISLAKKGRAAQWVGWLIGSYLGYTASVGLRLTRSSYYQLEVVAYMTLDLHLALLL